MNVVDERSRSFWLDTADFPHYPPLNENLNVEVLVIGAGIAGLSSAYELLRAGKTVAVLDRGQGGGMTARTTAHLGSACDDFYSDLVRRHGEAAARVFYESQHAAINRMQQIALEEEIDCDFARVDAYLCAATLSDETDLEEEAAAARTVGFTTVSLVEPPVPSLTLHRALLFPQQGRVDPLRYLAGLAASIERMGGRIFGDTIVTDVEEDKDVVTVTTADARQAIASAVIVATNGPISAPLTFHAKQAPYRTYAIAARLKAPIADALYWDTLDPYHYVRLARGRDGEIFLISGGEDHKSGEADDMDERFLRLESWTRDHFHIGEVTHRWSGQVNEPADAFPFIGLNPGDKRTYIVTGDSGQGITSGVAAGILLGHLAVGNEHAWAEAYDPSRSPLSSVGTLLKEQVSVIKQLAEHVTAGERDSLDDLRPGEGAILRDGLTKIAAYRDMNGVVHLRSATCTHAGCVVQWNSFEGCWDCPCHGSQFAIDGSVLQGPATKPLAMTEAAQT